MTSNAGSELIAGDRQPLGFDGGSGDGSGEGTGGATQAGERLRDQLMRRLREEFRPEFLNRIDEVIIFQRLESAQLRQITELMLAETRRRVHAQGVTIEVTPSAIGWLAERGYQPEFGARPMRRVIQRELDNELSRLMLSGQLHRDQHVRVDVSGERLRFEVVDRTPPPPGLPE
jgi:ATP-dependent Clp protease ATP-binding subunit ClpC